MTSVFKIFINSTSLLLEANILVSSYFELGVCISIILSKGTINFSDFMQRRFNYGLFGFPKRQFIYFQWWRNCRK